MSDLDLEGLARPLDAVDVFGPEIRDESWEVKARVVEEEISFPPFVLGRGAP